MAFRYSLRGRSPAPIRRVVAPLAALALALNGLAGTELADGQSATAAPKPGTPADRATALPLAADPDTQLGAGWRRSTDQAVVAVPTERGLTLLAAREREAYRWDTVASLAEPGLSTDLWTGQSCVTGDGRYAVAVYAPRSFANRPALTEQGGFVATVDLATGAVRKLPVRVSLAYFNPGCGLGSRAVLTAEDTENHGRTRLVLVDAARGTILRSTTAAGQLTSAAPYAGSVAAAAGNAVVSIDATGRKRVLARTAAVPYALRPDGSGGLGFVTADGTRASVWRLAGTTTRKIGTGRLGHLGLAAGAGGAVFVTGASGDEVRALPAGWRRLASDAEAVSSAGRLMVTGSRGPVDVQGREEDRRDIRIEAVTSTGKALRFAVSESSAAPDPTGSARPSPAAGRPRQHSGAIRPLTDSGTDPVDADRTCAVPRNDPHLQAYQPTGAQVEWAVDLAVQGALTQQRPANYLGWGLPAYSPQTLFKPVHLDGDGRIPAQVVLAILSQETNLWQASWHAVPGESGNSLVGDFYGTGDDIGWVDFSKADCGYGIGQITTGMRVGDTTWSDVQRKAIAVDYQANIAAALQILAQKWNETRQFNVTAHDGAANRIQNWWFAIWAYNSGFHHPLPQHPKEPWGVGWLNNPANPRYPAERGMFLAKDYDDATHPSYWSYPERVMGWASTPIIKNGKPAFAKAHYGWDPERGQPLHSTFCVQDKNECAFGTTNPNDQDEPDGPCTRSDLQCWWHDYTYWVPDCVSDFCGAEVLSYAPGSTEPAAELRYPPQCKRDGVVMSRPNITIVDDVPNDVRPQIPGTGQCHDNWSSAGTFTLQFNSSERGVYPSKADFHQISSGWGGHFWFAHSYVTGGRDQMGVTGTWTPNQRLSGWTRVMVHIPSHGAHTQQAAYKIYLGDGSSETRVLEQRREIDEWVSLGVFNFVAGSDTPRVSLSNLDKVGDGTEDVNYDALAFEKLGHKPKHFIVGLGDSFSSGEGTGNFEYYSDNNGTNAYRNACRRSWRAWMRQTTLPGAPDQLGQLEIAKDPDVDFQFKPCSGARTYNVVPEGVRTRSGDAEQEADGKDPHSAQYRWVRQLDAGFLDANTTLVMLSIGGNDSRFAKTVQFCLIVPDCGDSTMKGDSDPLKIAGPDYLNYVVKSSLMTTLGEIRRKAPNARIMLMGYPPLFSDHDCHDGFSGDERALLNSLSGQLAAQMGEAVKLMNDPRISFADPSRGATTPFYLHGICDDVPFINWVEFNYTDGDTGPHSPDMGSFHPNDAGQTAYAQVADAHLEDIGYNW